MTRSSRKCWGGEGSSPSGSELSESCPNRQPGQPNSEWTQAADAPASALSQRESTPHINCYVLVSRKGELDLISLGLGAFVPIIVDFTTPKLRPTRKLLQEGPRM
jgi:hypothetical protein